MVPGTTFLGNIDKSRLELTSMGPIVRDPGFVRINDVALGSNDRLIIFYRLEFIVGFFFQNFYFIQGKVKNN